MTHSVKYWFLKLVKRYNSVAQLPHQISVMTDQNQRQIMCTDEFDDGFPDLGLGVGVKHGSHFISN